MSKVLVAVLVLVLLLAGCTSAKSASVPATSGPPQGSVIVPADENVTETGSVSGRVVDDESRPVANATVAIVQVKVEVRTTVDGVFEFQNVPIGRYVFVANALGYESQTKGVEITAGENAAVVFTLEPIAILVPRIVALPHTFFVHLGFYGTSFAGGNTASCEACEWIPKIDKNPSHVVIEIKGKHTVPYPTRPDGLAVFLYKNGDSTYFSGCNWIGTTNDVDCLDLPMRREFNSTDLLDAVPAEKPVTAIRFWQWCDPFWVCVEERYDEWFSLFYETADDMVPRDYTAWPK
ncbi:MAG TPA: carboxypeptidase-like regulatory domain-containing protein [Candidatus Thermoplasmatota archaeon]|nr:carboxypeptidase-like regulatory domain-containing protein [Candidatus Thermoplasmatota archaeon]